MPENTANTLVVINPISGNTPKDDITKLISSTLKSKENDLEFYYTSGDKDRNKISKIIEKNKPATIIAVGGDGTCNMVAETILNKKVNLGIVPLGSANGLATELGIPANVEDSLEIIKKKRSKKIDVLQINQKYISLHLSDIGFNAQLINNYEEAEGIRGFAGYVRSFLGEIGNAQPAKFIINCEKETINKKAFMLVIANATKFGTGAIINPKGNLNDGFFELVVLQPQNFVHFLEMIIPFYTQKIHTLDFVDTYKCRKVSINNPDNQFLQIDGENMGQPGKVNVEILPQALQVCIPE
jgi:YegS/Rv2252/BmrU family lipid kinase